MATRLGKVVVGVVAGVVVAGAGVTVGVLGHRDLSAGAANSAAPTGLRSPSPSQPAATPAPPGALKPVLAAAGTPADSSSTAIAKRLATAGEVEGAHISAAVLSADSGKLLYSHGASSGLIPASVTKLLTTTAALKLMGPEHRFRTSVVEASSHKIVLVGGGDPYLAETRKQAVDHGQASLESLAIATAKRLRADKITSVKLGYDATLFSGSSWNPSWPDGYSTVVTPTSALWANEGRLYGSEGPRQDNPAESAANEFAAQLKKHGVKISSVAAASAPAGASEVAGVDSLPLSKIVERLLMASDNDAAEVVARQVAVASGKPGTITAAVSSIKKVLSGLGVWAPGTTIHDGSGLSRDGRIPSATLVKVLRLSVGGDQPGLSPVFTGLPVAGVEGSLRYRLDSGTSIRGRGLVRAKTGTLHDVHSLAGYAYTRDGELLIFAFVVNDAKSDYNAVLWLDRAAAIVATCGCTP